MPCMVRVCGVVVCGTMLCCGCSDQDGTQAVYEATIGWHCSESLSLAYYYATGYDRGRIDGNSAPRVVVFYEGRLTSAGALGPKSFWVSGPNLSVTLGYSSGDHFWIGKDGSVRHVSPLPARVYESIQSSKGTRTFDSEAFESCHSYEEVRRFLLRMADSTDRTPGREGPSS